jgi:putative ATPase
MDLFEDEQRQEPGTEGPLAARMRPRTLDDVVGQEHLLAEGMLLRRAISADRLNSLILYGPPGSGKTSVAEVIANVTRRRFRSTSGATANVSVLRNLLNTASESRRRDGEPTILFIDEIHRFNKAQQDILLPFVEDGSVVLIGATTHNPMFFINSPLTSRSLIFELRPLSEEAVCILLRRSLSDERGLGELQITADDSALEHLAMVCEGDARRALNALEIGALTTPPDADGTVHIDLAVAESSIQKKAVVYDHDEDGHYDTISGFIKSLRGSDPDAAVYWLAKMLYSGEDPRFVARRMVIFASEDVGNADPRALNIAVSAFSAVDFVGMPEARINLSQAATYLATAPKSNSSYAAVNKAWEDVEQGRTLEVPEHLRNVHLERAGEVGESAPEYKYPHDYEGNLVPQVYMPSSARYYVPGSQGYEATIRKRMETWARQVRQEKSE